MDDEKCIVFKSDEKKVGKRRIKSDESTPAKRRRHDAPTGLDASRQLREDVYRDLWNYQRDSIQSVLDEANSLTLNEITRFLEAQDLPSESGTIPSAFVLAGPDTTSHASFFKQLATRINNNSKQILVSLDASQCPNLKTLLKSLIQKITSQDEEEISDEYGTRLLDYDLQIAQIWLQDKGKNVMAVAIENSESFQSHLLSEMIDLFRYGRQCLKSG
jgi:origin recognition complex subunit 3